MKKPLVYIVFIFLLLGLSSCKEPEIVPNPEPKQWEKFIGDYKVYDTLGFYLYDAEIKHFSGVNEFGNTVDSLLIVNFADKLDLDFKFGFNQNTNYFDFKFHDSVADYTNKSWHVSIIYEDPFSEVIENELKNDTMILYFRMTNLPYYINESVPYFDCYCKHVFVKQ